LLFSLEYPIFELSSKQQLNKTNNIMHYQIHYQDHIIIFAVFGSGCEIFSCELLIDGFQFDGILSDAAIHQAIQALKSEWMEVTPKYPYNPSASAMEVLKNHAVYSPEKVATAKKIMAPFYEGYVNSRHRGN